VSRFGQSVEVIFENGKPDFSNVSIRIRRRALNALRERQMPLIRVEPRINSSLREEFVRFLFLVLLFRVGCGGIFIVLKRLYGLKHIKNEIWTNLYADFAGHKLG